MQGGSKESSLEASISVDFLIETSEFSCRLHLLEDPSPFPALLGILAGRLKLSSRPT